jgi:hypothetical protein
MKKLNLDFIGEIVSSPKGMCSWSGTGVTFWGKFKNVEGQKWGRFEREHLIEAICISEERPSKEHYECVALQIVPDNYKFLDTTTITKEQLEQLWNAIEYTRGTISRLPQQSAEKPDWVLIHKGRAHQSMAFLGQAIELVNQLKKECK